MMVIRQKVSSDIFCQRPQMSHALLLPMSYTYFFLRMWVCWVRPTVSSAGYPFLGNGQKLMLSEKCKNRGIISDFFSPILDPQLFSFLTPVVYVLLNIGGFFLHGPDRNRCNLLLQSYTSWKATSITSF